MRRLTGDLRAEATRELVSILINDGPMHTGAIAARCPGLSLYQIRALLRESGRVVEELYGSGMYTSTFWVLQTVATKGRQ